MQKNSSSHLLKLADAEDEVSGRDFVAEGFSNLRHAKGNLAAGGALDVLEVDKDALRRLGPQEELALAVLGHALEGLEHQVELADVGKVALAAHRAHDVVLADVGEHLLVAPAGGG